MQTSAQPIKIAVLAMGGEGGGVLANWLVAMAEAHDWIAQMTSVPGVAQRTGATIYYVELFPAAASREAGAAPVLALMPLPGDVDIVVASELMEAARAVQRGLVTRERTTLVASTHRVYAIAEKIALGDGRADAAALLADARGAAKRFIGFDMAATAEAQGSVISAVLFGALAATGALPFSREQFEATVQRGGVGVAASLRAFGVAFEMASKGETAAPAAVPPSAFALPRSPDPTVQALIDRAAATFAGDALRLVIEGLRRLVDYQDAAYAALFLDRLAAAPRALHAELARQLALAMAYEDTIRVAELKTRDTRFARVRSEVRAGSGQVLRIAEFMHPRLQEIAETLPAALGRRLLRDGLARRCVERFASRGRVVQTSSLGGFLLLWGVARLRGLRRATLRFQLENERIEAWLDDVAAAAKTDLALAAEVVRCRNLVKGYGETHARGLASYERIRAAWLGGAKAAAVARLRAAALADDDGKALQRELQQLSAPQAAVA